MKKILAMAALLGIGLSLTTEASACPGKRKRKTVQIESRSGSTLAGTAKFVERRGVVTMTVNVGATNLGAGQHAIHLHEKGDCSAADGSSAGGHWNPTADPHGMWGHEAGHHKGDIGNLTLDANGKGTLTFSTDKWCIDCGDEKKNIVGKSIIIHAKVDDFQTQPTGNAGGRIGCGVIR